MKQLQEFQKMYTILSKSKLVIFIAVFTVLFCILLALNLSPALRGPIDPIFPSLWPYYFVNTFSKVWAPLLAAFIYLLLFKFVDKRIEVLTKKRVLTLLFSAVVVVFLFQISLVYFSRFGINVLFRRIADPGINGYFTAATSITNLHNFLVDFPKLLITSLPQHSRGDPPGPILFMYLVINLFKYFHPLTNFLYGFIRAPITDAQHLWSPLLEYERVAAVFLGFFMHLLSAVTLIPFYFLIKELVSKKIAIRAAFIWGVIPSLTFFSLIFDPVYTLFPIITFILLIKGYRSKNFIYFFTGGVLYSFGLFFNLSYLPLTLFILIMLFFVKNISRLNTLLYFLSGIVVVPLFLLFLGYDSISSILVLISSQTPRSYLPWLFYNLYDVFIYMGIPVSLLFGLAVVKINLLKRNEKIVLLSYLVTLAVLSISGISRGEAGRIWIPLMIVPVGFTGYFLTEKLKYKTFQFAIILTLLIFECIILEEFWVPIW